MAPSCRGVGPLPCPGRSDRPGRAARSADAGRGVRAVPASHVPGQDPLLDRGPRHDGPDPGRRHCRSGRSRHPQHPDRNGSPRALERDGARAEQAVHADPRRVQGPGLVEELSRGHGVDRGREVSRRGAPRDQGRPRDGPRRVHAAKPQPSRSDRSGCRRHGPRRGNARRGRRRVALRSVAEASRS